MKNLRALLHALTGIALGALWFSLYVTLWASGLGMLVTLLGIPIIWLTLYLTPYFAAVEVELARGLLGADAYVPPKISGWELRTRLALKANWHAQLYMLMRFIPGLLLQCVLIGLVVQGIALVVGPVWYWAPKDGIDLGIVQIDELWEAFLFIPVGFAAIAAGWWLAGPYGRYQRHLAEQLLHGETVEVGPRKLGLEIGGTFAVCAVLQTICLIVWLATGTTSNWVVFTGIGLATPVLLQAALKGGGGRAGPVRQHAMFGTVVVAVCVALWIATDFSGYFWPIWVALGWGVSLVIPALFHSGARSVAPRLEQLTRTRAEVVGAQEDELRRIERDLHDGAQARLVSMAMSLGLAEQQLDEDPDGARVLVTEAQEQVRLAIRELRDLARAIAPPVLTDRGLAAAIESLSATSPLPVVISGTEGTPRPPASVERAAYFVAAESLANAAKHAGAQRIDVRLARVGDRLEVEVADNGRGGANPHGPGLNGLRQRVEAIDGSLTIESPAGAGTTIRASLPCAPS